MSGMSGTSINFDNQDPTLRSIAQELHSSLNQEEIPNDSSRSTKAYDFQLQSLLTRPRSCTTLFPPRVLKERRQKITLQERLILVSVKPVEDPNSSSVSSSVSTSSKPTEPTATSSAVLVAGLEVLEYTLSPTGDAASDSRNSSSAQQSPPRQERIVYVAKVDTSGCWPLPGLETQSLKSPAQALVKGYLRAMRSHCHECGTGNMNAADHMSSLSLSPPHAGEGHHQDPKQDQNQDQHQGRENISKTSFFVFARAQPQYLFAESAKNVGKRVLDDRGLVRWWKNMITSAYSTPSSSTSSSSLPSSSSVPSKTQGWWLIPGIETERQAMNVIQSKPTLQTPATTSTSTSTAGTPVLLQYGYSDKGSTAMAHTLIPQFPDDPKSRMMKSPSCQGGFVDIKTFWELAAIGEESGAGKITGFFKVVEEVEIPAERLSSESKTKTGSSASTTTTTITTTTTAATTSTACLTGSTGDYTRAINFLLELNFSTHDRAQESTQQWLDRLEVWTKKATLRHAEAIVGATSSDVVKDAPLQTKSDEVQLQETKDLKTDTTTAPSPMDRRSSRASPLWIQQGTVRIQLLQAHNSSAGQTSAASGSVPADAAAGAVVHTLNANLIKRKPQQQQQQQQQQAHSLSTPSDATTASPQVNVLGGNLIKRKPIAGGTETPAVNVLGSNLIKRKPATTLAASTLTSTTTTTTAEAAVTSTTPVPASDSPTPSEPTVNILGSNFIKKRKLDP